jgi:hypothetical protein
MLSDDDGWAVHRRNMEFGAAGEEAVAAAEMTMREAEEFIASVPWRAVKMVEVGDTGRTPQTRTST